ncbi:MAG: 5-oxoprolinase [Betaproteobacteria bacterium RIFCSPLOWO2_02_FULL_63_19]|nr:MAG: 5-oxoprolinase [Betaproteobacteria bacterium RIFCSPLOWO2_02_FULL_63_19]
MQEGNWRIGVDIGGTFTDLVITGPAGEVHVFKVPSIPADPAQGVMNALERAAGGLSLTLSGLLSDCAMFVHGSTVATNTALERTGACVGLLTTRGFRDSLEIRRGKRDTPWDHRTPNPPVLVPRYLRLPVGGRIDRDGNEIEPLNLDDVRAAVATFAQEGVESVAICLLNSFANPAHEQAAAQAVGKHWKGRWISVSSDISPLVGEYERTSTTAMNAYVAPRAVGYLRALNDRLRANGFPHSILLIQNNGGAISIDQVAGKPVRLLLSGPAAGVGALQFYSRAIGSGNLISMEIGGTSCDVILMRDGSVPTTDQFQVAGYHLSVPAIDMHTIGAGGGTIAGTDNAGMLFAGPQGAGAHPGPAAYGVGGTQPTVTDAQLVLGRLKPGPYAGGSVTLDRSLATQSIERAVARPLGISVDAAATGIIRLVEQNLLQAVQRISIERGYDPRQFVLVAGGGAGPMHGAVIGRMLSCPKVYVPRLSGAFCALGMLHSNVRHDYVKVHVARLDDEEPAVLEAAYRELEDRATGILRDAGFAPQAMRVAREMDLRYLGQQWDVRVALEGASRSGRKAVRQAFEAEYERLFGHHQPGGIIELTTLRVIGIGLLPPLHPAAGTPAEAPAKPIEKRSVYLDAQLGRAETAVYRGVDLMPGHRIAGPLLVEEQTTTVFAGPDDILEVDAANNFVIHLPRGEVRHGA